MAVSHTPASFNEYEKVVLLNRPDIYQLKVKVEILEQSVNYLKNNNKDRAMPLGMKTLNSSH